MQSITDIRVYVFPLNVSDLRVLMNILSILEPFIAYSCLYNNLCFS